MGDLEKLIEKCKCSVSIDIDEHKNYYEDVKTFIDGLNSSHEIDDDVLSYMIKLNSIVRIQFYPDTPIGFYVCYHHSLEECIKDCLSIFDEKSGDKNER